VPEDSTLAGLHRVVQAAMGWDDRHLWRMQIGAVEYSDLPMEAPGDPVQAARDVSLAQVAAPGDVLLYEYDFGDAWEHRILVERIVPAGPEEPSPVCVAAEGACPPEDCGGVSGYERLLEALADPDDPDHEAVLGWLGGPFDPDAVSLDEINALLASTDPLASGPETNRSGSTAPLNPAEAATRELRVGIEQALAENPGASVDDLNAALETLVSDYNRRPQAALGGLSPAGMQRLLSADWVTEASAVRLDESLSAEDLAAASTLHNARLFLAELGERRTVKATPKGNLTRAFVGAMEGAMRWPATSRFRDTRSITRNEEDVWPLHLLRILLELGGLIKRRKGVFSLTRAGERLAHEARVGALLATLFRAHFQRLNLGYLDGLESLPEFQRTVAYALYRFGRVGDDWKPPLALKADLVLPGVADAMPPRENRDSWEILLENRLLGPLEGLGLAQVRTLPRDPGEWVSRREYRKSPLFDRFLTFELAG
jgi:hypothetical protein